MLPEVGEKRYNQRVMKPNADREVFNLRVIAVFASTVNGKIALSHDDRSEWTSSEDKKYFKSLTSRIGVVIMGRKPTRQSEDSIRKVKCSFDKASGEIPELERIALYFDYAP